jgi:1-acyl-sn-glycerol-3-phosphate acyltransferase
MSDVNKLYPIFTRQVWILTYFLCWLFLRPFYKFRVKIHPEFDLTTKAPILIISNHRSMFDPWIISGSLPFKIFRQLLPIRMLGSKKFSHPIVNMLNKLGAIPVVYFFYNVIPIGGATFEEKIAGPVQALNHGETVFMFPEGKININSDDVLAEFKKGFAAIDRQTHVPILPVFVNYEHGRGFRTKCTVKFDKLTALPERARQKLHEEEMYALDAKYLRRKVMGLARAG